MCSGITNGAKVNNSVNQNIPNLHGELAYKFGIDDGVIFKNAIPPFTIIMQ
jgi:hypothetical protein